VDQDWRALERLWRSDPGDQDALHRAITARRRAGLPVPSFLLQSQVFEPRTVTASVPLDVFALLPDGRAVGLGQAPASVPEHRELWVSPIHVDERRLGPAIDEVCAQRIQGLALPPGVTSRGLGLVGRAGHLVRLDLAGCGLLTDDALATVSELPHLATLVLWWCAKITDAGLAHLARASSLVNLNLARLKKITDAGVAHLGSLTELAALNLSDCPAIGDDAVRALARLSRLTFLDLAGTDLTDDGLRALAPLRELTILNLSRCPALTPEGLEALAALENLAIVYVVSCGETSRKAEKILARALPRCHVVAAAAPERPARDDE
jgi:hypothetical protein